MEVPHTQAENSATQTLLLDPSQAVVPQEEPNDAQLNHSLHRLETFLRVFGFCQYSFLSFTLSWVWFLLLGVGVPLLFIQISYCSDCERYQIKSFELQILISESFVAAISLLCISHNLRKYGVRRFLFVDRYHGHMTQFREEYIQKINVSKTKKLPTLLIIYIIFLIFWLKIGYFSFSCKIQSWIFCLKIGSLVSLQVIYLMGFACNTSSWLGEGKKVSNAGWIEEWWLIVILQWNPVEIRIKIIKLGENILACAGQMISYH